MPTLDQILLYTAVGGFWWFAILTIYYSMLSKRRAVVSMLASFGVASIVALWTTTASLVGIGIVNYWMGGGLELSWSFLVSVVEAAYIIAFLILTWVFIFNQWGAMMMFRRYRMLANDEVTKEVNEMVDVNELLDKFEIDQLEILAVDDIEAGAHAMAVAKPSLLSPRWGKDIMVVKSPLVKILEPEELEAVIAHELAHVEGLDSRFRPYFETLSEVYFFDPHIQMIKNYVKKQQEYGADDRAVEVTGNPASLARALIKVAEYESDMRGLSFNVKERAERLAAMVKQ